MAWIHIIRPLNVFLAMVSVGIAAFLLDALKLNSTLMTAALVVASFTGAANILNDIFDRDIDRKNRPHRPIPSGAISLPAAYTYTACLFGNGIILSYYSPPTANVIALLIVFPLLILYTPVLKKIPLAGNLTIAAILGVVFIYTEAALTGTVSKMWIPAALAFGLSMIRELVKDIQDIPGDSAEGIQTFPTQFGILPSLRLAVFLTLLLCTLAPIPFFQDLYGWPYLIALIFGVEVPLILSIFYLWKNPTSAASGKVSGLLKGITMAGMIVILLSWFN